MNEETTALLTQTADLLLANGQTTEGTRLAVERLARAQGHPVRFTARWGEYVLQAPDRMVFGEVAPTGVDIARVEATETVVEDICFGRTESGDGLNRLRAIGRSEPVALPRFVPMAAAGAAALGVIFGADDWLTIVLIAASAGVGALARRVASHASENPFLQPLVASLLAGMVGGLATRTGLPVVDRLVVLCPCMVLVPGPHFLNGAMDLVRARIPIGAGRIGLALLVVLTICGGLLGGLALTGSAFPSAGVARVVPFGYDVLSAGVAVAAYGSFFNMPWRLTALPIVVGMVAHAARWELLDHGASLQMGAFAATLLVGMVTAPMADRFRLPFGASAFAAVVSLVPGILMFAAASATLDAVDLGTKADAASLLPIVDNGLTAVVVLIAMAAGLILPKLAYHALVDYRGRR